MAEQNISEQESQVEQELKKLTFVYARSLRGMPAEVEALSLSDIHYLKMKLLACVSRKECPTDFDRGLLPRTIKDKHILALFEFSTPYLCCAFSTKCEFVNGSCRIPISLLQMNKMYWSLIKIFFTRITSVRVEVWYNPKPVDAFEDVSPSRPFKAHFEPATDYLKMKKIRFPTQLGDSPFVGRHSWTLGLDFVDPLKVTEISAFSTFVLESEELAGVFGTCTVLFNLLMDSL